MMSALVSRWFWKELFPCTSHRTLLSSQLSLLNCWEANSFRKKLIDGCSTKGLTSALDYERWPEVSAGRSGTVPFTSSNLSILLYYQTTMVIVCSFISFIHCLAKKRLDILNAVCSNWCKICSQLIIQRNIVRKLEIISTWSSCCHWTASFSKGEWQFEKACKRQGLWKGKVKRASENAWVLKMDFVKCMC